MRIIHRIIEEPFTAFRKVRQYAIVPKQANMIKIMNKLTRYLCISLTFVLGVLPGIKTSQAYGDFVCSQEVSYKWAPLQKPSLKEEQEKQEKQESVIHWGSYQQSGMDEASAKEALGSIVVREQKRASEMCHELHENLAGCIAAKFGTHKAEFSEMDFATRKSLQEAIGADCKEQQGKCTETLVTEAKCFERKKAEEAAPAGGDAKKDDKGKKKK